MRLLGLATLGLRAAMLGVCGAGAGFHKGGLRGLAEGEAATGGRRSRGSGRHQDGDQGVPSRGVPAEGEGGRWTQFAHVRVGLRWGA